MKQRIASLQGLPVLPHLAREVLVALDAGSVHWEELAAIAAFDEPMASALHRAAVRERGCDPDLALEAHLVALGLARVAELVLKHLTPDLFDAPRSHGIDLKAFWAHAFSVARFSREIAEKTKSRYAPVAYVAGLLHDIGKPALDRVVPGGYTRALELVRQQGLYALEAERRELGADHTVAGKWLAESWGLPATLVASIWLHHHPPGTLDNTPYPVELIEIVSLANFLAHGDEIEAAPQERVAAMDENRWSRLGLDRVDVIELLRKGVDDTATPVEKPDNGRGPETKPEIREDVGRLRQERDFYAALCALHEGMQPGLAPADQLRLLIDGLRRAFAISAGLCYLAVDPAGSPVVLRWHNLTESPVQVVLKGTSGMSASLDELISALGGAGDAGAPKQSGAVHRHGFMALPLLNHNKSIGQLIFQTGQGGPALSESFLNLLMRFMKAAGTALARCHAVRGAYEEAESLAAAVWKQELSHRNDRRTERLISVGKMAAGAAHEINNPLAVISGKAQLLLANAERAEDRKALEVIVEHSQRASGILRDLLQFARPNPPQLLPSRIGSLLRAAIDKVRQRLEEEGIQLVEDYAQDLPLVQVDRIQMDQVFHNILQNAEQAMARQGDKLTVRVRANQDRTAVIVQIIDTGQGIAADVMDKVFEPFFTTHSGNEGTGMGLAVCHGIVEAHRGTITLHSQEGAGTTCTLTLPVTAAREVAPAPETPASIPSRDAAPGRPAPTPSSDRAPREPLAPAAATFYKEPERSEPAPSNTRDPRESLAPAAATFYKEPERSESAPSRADRPSDPPTAPQAPPRAYAPENADSRDKASREAESPAPPAARMAPEVEAAMRARTDARHTAPARSPADFKGNLLLVDQDSELREVLAEALRNRGYHVQTATDGLEALAEVIAHRVDVVMLDANVPGVNAPQELVDEIQRRKPDLPAIVLVGASVKHDIGGGHGHRHILRKPFEVSQLFGAIEQSIAARDVA